MGGDGGLQGGWQAPCSVPRRLLRGPVVHAHARHTCSAASWAELDGGSKPGQAVDPCPPLPPPGTSPAQPPAPQLPGAWPGIGCGSAWTSGRLSGQWGRGPDLKEQPPHPLRDDSGLCSDASHPYPILLAAGGGGHIEAQGTMPAVLGIHRVPARPPSGPLRLRPERGPCSVCLSIVPRPPGPGHPTPTTGRRSRTC